MNRSTQLNMNYSLFMYSLVATTPFFSLPFSGKTSEIVSRIFSRFEDNMAVKIIPTDMLHGQWSICTLYLLAVMNQLTGLLILSCFSLILLPTESRVFHSQRRKQPIMPSPFAMPKSTPGTHFQSFSEHSNPLRFVSFFNFFF